MERSNRKNYGFTSSLISLVLALTLVASPSVAQAAISWLAGQSGPDGAIASAADIATPVQSTSETLRTFFELGETSQTSIPGALSFLDNDPHYNTEYLARKIIATYTYDGSATIHVDALLAVANSDGGFGEHTGFESTALNTAFALDALASAGQLDDPIAGLAIDYLVSHVQADGSWTNTTGDPSIYITALISQALQRYATIYPLDAVINQANAYLLAQADAQGAIGEVFTTAHALLAIAPATFDKASFQAVVDYLQSRQSADGSWGGDVYVTALATRALAATTSATPPDPALGSVSGLVRDAVSGDPLAGVTITISGAANTVAVTGADGRYAVHDLALGSIDISAALAGYLSATANTTLLAGTSLDFSPNLERDPQPTALSVTGVIVDATTSAPLEGATIKFLGTTFSGLSAANGGFLVNDIPPGSYNVEISFTGYVTATFLVAAPAGGVVDLGTVALRTGTAAGDTGTVRGRVLEAISGEPLRNVTISLSGADTKVIYTGDDGGFLIAGVTPGAITTTASLAGYKTALVSGVLEAGKELNFSVKLIAAGDPSTVTLRGVVVDWNTSLPLGGAQVSTTHTTLSTNAGADGSFQLNGLPTGMFDVRISAAVDYNGAIVRVDAPNGGLVDLGTITLALKEPIGSNRYPVITSTAPLLAVAGEEYLYAVQAHDPDGDPITFSLSGYPTGMSIDPVTGHIRWLPDASDIGVTRFTLVVYDDQGGVTGETVNLEVTPGGSRAYVATDVDTLTGILLDRTVPENHVLGGHVSGGVADSVVVTPSCPLTATDTIGDVTGVLANLDGLGSRTGPGSDLIFDMTFPYSSFTVFPQIDLGILPEEGIDYTVWGANDLNAVFPQGWTLATLVGIYKQGWNNDPACTGDESDDYAGLYSFAPATFRYMRVRSDHSISIFATPDQTSWQSSGDEGIHPGRQSATSEIDAVAGMKCDVPPVADAGIDIYGVAGQIVRFNAGSTPGSAEIFAWDLDGDKAIDLTGATPEHVFATTFDGDVTLFVVDNQGCVGSDKVHVTIGLDYPKPDLSVSAISSAAVVNDAQTLAVTGAARISLTNTGQAPAAIPALVVVFEDLDGDGAYSVGADNVLGAATMPTGLDQDASLEMNVPLAGTVSFRDSPLLAMVDGDRRIDEEREDNNTASAATACRIQPRQTSGQFNPVLKFNALKGLDVISTPMVANLTDDNGDGLINEYDIPDIVFSTKPSGQLSGGEVRAISGDDGRQLFITDSAYQVGAVSELAIGDIDGDSLPEIVGPYEDGRHLVAFEHDGQFKWLSDSELLPGRYDSGGAISIANLDGVGPPEIIIGASVYSADGKLLGNGKRLGGTVGYSYYTAVSSVADIDLDGQPEIIAGPTVYRLVDGVLKKVWQRTDRYDGFVGIGNFDDDPYAEIVVVGIGRVYMLNHDGTDAEIWGGPIRLPGGGYGGAPTIADVDGDGFPEIGVAGARYYTVFGRDGSIRWSSPTQDYSSHTTGSTSFDFEGDGTAEIVYRDERYLRIYQGNNGTVRMQYPISSGTATDMPVVADVDNDGHAEIVVCADRLYGGPSSGIHVFEDASDSWIATRTIWNQHSYHIDNVNDDATIPLSEKASWLSHNTYRLNAYPDRDPLDAPDLTASLLRVVDNGPNQTASLIVRIGNAGTGFAESVVSFFQGDPTAGGVLLGSVPTDSVATGTYTDVTLTGVTSLSGQTDIHAVVDYQEQLIECNENNNHTAIPVFVQSIHGVISVATDAVDYGPSSPVILSASVTNTSALPGRFRAELHVEDGVGARLASFDLGQVGPLPGGQATMLTADWNTNGYYAGPYQVRGMLYSIDGVPLDDDASPFAIRADLGAPVVTLNTSTDRPVYHTTDSVRIGNQVSNISSNTLVRDARLRVTVNDPGGLTVFSTIQALGDLVPGVSREVPVNYTLQAAAQGGYKVLGEVLDSADQLLASDPATFTVREDLRISLGGKVEVLLPVVERGHAQSCTDTLSNQGSQDLADLGIRQILMDMDTRSVLVQQDDFIELAAGAARHWVRDIDTSNLTEGTYTCFLQADIANTWETLAYAEFRVTEPRTHIDASLGLGDRGLLLVLLDDEPANGNAPPDPHAPRDAPDLPTQRAYLEALLDANGWIYTIVSDETDFANELRSGKYSIYALFSEHEKLDEQVQKELREAVHRGEGLLVAGAHDQRNHLGGVLGIKYRGKYTNAIGLELFDGGLLAPADTQFTYEDQVLRVELEGAAPAGAFLFDAKGALGDTTAVTTNGYGLGQSAYVGFDLLGQATAAGPGMLDELIIGALEHVRPRQPVIYPGSVIPLRLTLSNQGTAAHGRTLLTLPPGVELIDSGGALALANGELSWSFELLEAETSHWLLMLRLPLEAGLVTFTALVQTGTEQGWVDHATLQFEATVLPAATAMEIIAELDLLAGGDKNYSKALKAVETASEYLAAANFDKALATLIKATDDLSAIDAQAAIESRVRIDVLIREISIALAPIGTIP